MPRIVSLVMTVVFLVTQAGSLVGYQTSRVVVQNDRSANLVSQTHLAYPLALGSCNKPSATGNLLISDMLKEGEGLLGMPIPGDVAETIQELLHSDVEASLSPQDILGIVRERIASLTDQNVRRSLEYNTSSTDMLQYVEKQFDTYGVAALFALSRIHQLGEEEEDQQRLIRHYISFVNDALTSCEVYSSAYRRYTVLVRFVMNTFLPRLYEQATVLSVFQGEMLEDAIKCDIARNDKRCWGRISRLIYAVLLVRDYPCLVKKAAQMVALQGDAPDVRVRLTPELLYQFVSLFDVAGVEERKKKEREFKNIFTLITDTLHTSYGVMLDEDTCMTFFNMAEVLRYRLRFASLGESLQVARSFPSGEAVKKRIIAYLQRQGLDVTQNDLRALMEYARKFGYPLGTTFRNQRYGTVEAHGMEARLLFVIIYAMVYDCSTDAIVQAAALMKDDELWQNLSYQVTEEVLLAYMFIRRDAYSIQCDEDLRRVYRKARFMILETIAHPGYLWCAWADAIKRQIQGMVSDLREQGSLPGTNIRFFLEDAFPTPSLIREMNFNDYQRLLLNESIKKIKESKYAQKMQRLLYVGISLNPVKIPGAVAAFFAEGDGVRLKCRVKPARLGKYLMLREALGTSNCRFENKVLREIFKCQKEWPTPQYVSYPVFYEEWKSIFAELQEILDKCALGFGIGNMIGEVMGDWHSTQERPFPLLQYEFHERREPPRKNDIPGDAICNLTDAYGTKVRSQDVVAQIENNGMGNGRALLQLSRRNGKEEATTIHEVGVIRVSNVQQQNLLQVGKFVIKVLKPRTVTDAGEENTVKKVDALIAKEIVSFFETSGQEKKSKSGFAYYWLPRGPVAGYGGSKFMCLVKEFMGKEYGPLYLCHEAAGVVEGRLLDKIEKAFPVKDFPGQVALRDIPLHVYMRGCEQDVRDTYDRLESKRLKEKKSSLATVDTMWELILIMSEGMDRILFQDEIRLITFNWDNGYRGKACVQGFHDRYFGEPLNTQLTKALKDWMAPINNTQYQKAQVIMGGHVEKKGTDTFFSTCPQTFYYDGRHEPTAWQRFWLWWVRALRLPAGWEKGLLGKIHGYPLLRENGQWYQLDDAPGFRKFLDQMDEHRIVRRLREAWTPDEVKGKEMTVDSILAKRRAIGQRSDENPHLNPAVKVALLLGYQAVRSGGNNTILPKRIDSIEFKLPDSQISADYWWEYFMKWGDDAQSVANVYQETFAAQVAKVMSSRIFQERLSRYRVLKQLHTQGFLALHSLPATHSPQWEVLEELTKRPFDANWYKQQAEHLWKLNAMGELAKKHGVGYIAFEPDIYDFAMSNKDLFIKRLRCYAQSVPLAMLKEIQEKPVLADAFAEVFGCNINEAISFYTWVRAVNRVFLFDLVIPGYLNSLWDIQTAKKQEKPKHWFLEQHLKRKYYKGEFYLDRPSAVSLQEWVGAGIKDLLKDRKEHLWLLENDQVTIIEETAQWYIDSLVHDEPKSLTEDDVLSYVTKKVKLVPKKRRVEIRPVVPIKPSASIGQDDASAPKATDVQEEIAIAPEITSNNGLQLLVDCAVYGLLAMMAAVLDVALWYDCLRGIDKSYVFVGLVLLLNIVVAISFTDTLVRMVWRFFGWIRKRHYAVLTPLVELEDVTDILSAVLPTKHELGIRIASIIGRASQGDALPEAAIDSLPEETREAFLAFANKYHAKTPAAQVATQYFSGATQADVYIALQRVYFEAMRAKKAKRYKKFEKKLLAWYHKAKQKSSKKPSKSKDSLLQLLEVRAGMHTQIAA